MHRLLDLLPAIGVGIRILLRLYIVLLVLAVCLFTTQELIKAALIFIHAIWSVLLQRVVRLKGGYKMTVRNSPSTIFPVTNN